MKPWKQYQEDAASIFRGLGFKAETDVPLEGVRTSHDIDVLVTSNFHGFDIRWLVECKLWKKPINKLHVLALREIVADTGADRGIILSESGFQSGAIEAANMTNIQASSLEHIKMSSEQSVFALRLREQFDRLVLCKDRYWDLPKSTRIQYGLRYEFDAYEYSGAVVIDACNDVLTRAFKDIYPFKSRAYNPNRLLGTNKQFNSVVEVVQVIEPMIALLEKKLDDCESAIETLQGPTL